MNGLKTLVFMQIKDKIDLSYLKSKKSTIFKIVLSVIKFAVITAAFWLGFFVLGMLHLVSLQPGIPTNFFSALFTIMFILSIIVCTFGLMKNLYYTKDNPLLLTLPANRTTVFTSKLLVYYIYELVRNINYMLPLLLAYCIINGLPIYFYLWLIVGYFVVTAVPVVIGALLSIPMMYITNFVKQHKWLEYILVAGTVTGVILGLLAIINAIPEDLDIIGSWGTTFWKIQDFLTKFNKILVPFYWLVVALVGVRYGTANQIFTGKQFLCMGGTLLAVAAVIGITYLLVRPLFFHMASSPFEFKKKNIKKSKRNWTLNGFISAIKKEVLLNYRTPEKFYGLLAVVAGLPISILLLNRIYAAMDTKLAGTNMTIVFNILMILLIALASNASVSRAYSEEGASSYLIKTSPKSYLQSLFAKICINAVTMTISILITTIIFCDFMQFTFIKTLLIFIMIESLYIAHLVWSAEMDFMNPQTQQYQTTGTHSNNPNEVKSTVFSFVLSVMFALLTFFFISKSPNSVWIKLMLMAVAFCALRIYLYIIKIKVYFKEK